MAKEINWKTIGGSEEEDRQRKRVLFVFLGGAGLLGTVVFWLLSPLMFRSIKNDDLREAGIFYDELSRSQDATEAEIAYLDRVNQPDRITEMNMDDSSLALIKGEGRKKEAPAVEPPPRVSTMNNMRQAVADKLGQMRGFAFSPSGSFGRGYDRASDYKGDLSRFAKGSGFEGGNVRTGPAATKFAGSGRRDASFDPKIDQLASAVGKKFDGDIARAVDPKQAAKDLGNSIPADLQKALEEKKPDEPDVPKKNEFKDREKDPCAGIEKISSKEAATNLLMGLGMMVGGFLLSNVGGETASQKNVTYGWSTDPDTGKSVRVAIASSETGGTKGSGFGSQTGGSLANQGIGLFTQGIQGFVDPESRIRACRENQAGISKISAARSDGGGK